MSEKIAEIPAVILAGGLGTRIREESEFRPKPMIEIGGKPILWHIMRHLSTFGIKEFIICAGYKSEVIKEYFLNFRELNSDFRISLNGKSKITFYSEIFETNWDITIAETGKLTNTGGRLKFVEKYIAGREFFVTYGDGLSDVSISKLYETHLKFGRQGTVTAVNPVGRFGVLEIEPGGNVKSFSEKVPSNDWVNGGFMFFRNSFLKQLGFNSVLEQDALPDLARNGELFAYRHNGFWQPMDTYRETILLNELWNSNSAPWKNWK